MSDEQQPYRYSVDVPRRHLRALGERYEILEPLGTPTGVSGFIKTSAPIPEDVLESLVKSFAGLSIQESRPQ
jgi:hypothetical protein